MSSITVSSLVLGSLTVTVDGTDSSLSLSILATAPASLSIELGTPGATGATGTAATIAAGTVTTLSPGASATVTNAGTSSAAVFNFGIPQGTAGSQGIPGTAATATAGTTTTGAPGSSASVTNSGTTAAAVFNFTIPRGDVGATGATGATGDTGATGAGVATGGTAGQSLLKVDGTDYNTTWGTPNLASHAETTQATVRNATGSTLTAGQIVYINGAIGNQPSVALSQANSEATSAGTYAMVETAIANNTNASVITSGTVTGLDTSALTDGDKLYLSPTVAGGWTTTKPSAPNHMVYIGTVTRSHPTLGTIQLRIQNGYELEELHNVAIASVADKDLLAYETSTTLWKNKSISTLGLAPLASPGLTGTPTTTTAAADTNTTQIASTAYVVGQASASAPSNDASAAAVGTSLKYARADHVHLNPLPTGGTAAQVLSKVDGTDYNVQWATASGGGGVDVQVFGGPSSSGTFTWTKPANAKMVYVWMVGGGGGGGSGARRATTVNRGGGGGGGGGNAYARWLNAAGLGATETVTVGTGVTGAAGITVNDTNGNTPATSSTVFSAFGGFRTYGGYGGGGGGTTTGGGTAGTTGNHLVDFGTLSSVIGVPGLAGAITDNTNQANGYFGGLTACGGGGGAGQSASLTASATGGFGVGYGAYSASTGPGLQTAIAGGTRGQPSPLTPAGNGVAGGFSSSFTSFRAGTGGGGGYYISGQPGGAGGNGAWPAGGGGGGGASDNGQTSGAGGNGANGIVVIITYS
ncbi:hypothetical protein UFOVP1233_41 [uncultured Caudovirales phage]|uniref:Collagen triple helix repeat n=1 Tax=uncultured Caudovirales phage TaxID=2100421 RepID=A0A6J5RFX2_9CAUD|nr:hypothetical protein UFOVP1233_41 [uncultured Caudovirales phage]